MRLNDTDLGGWALNDLRHAIGTPCRAQRPGENRLRFTFAAAVAPADLDQRDSDRRRLAAAFYSLTVGPEGDAGLDDLLAREAPDPFAVSEAGGLPSLVQVGPSVVRYAVRLPPGAELRFTADLHPSARAAAASASFRVTIEARPGEERELWARVIGTARWQGRRGVAGPASGRGRHRAPAACTSAARRVPASSGT